MEKEGKQKKNIAVCCYATVHQDTVFRRSAFIGSIKSNLREIQIYKRHSVTTTTRLFGKSVAGISRAINRRMASNYYSFKFISSLST